MQKEEFESYVPNVITNEYIAIADDIQKGSLIVVDIQNDFLQGGPLEAQDADSVIYYANYMMKTFRDAQLPVVLTQDWHPKGHYSFASTHNMEPFQEFNDYGIGPVLWPDHCIQGTPGAEFSMWLDTDHATSIVRKGYNKEIDSYSGFLENDHQTETGLDGILKKQYIDRVFVCGLAYDYCVYFTALDAAKKGYETYVVIDGTQFVGVPEGSITRCTNTLLSYNVKFIESDKLTYYAER